MKTLVTTPPAPTYTTLSALNEDDPDTGHHPLLAKDEHDELVYNVLPTPKLNHDTFDPAAVAVISIQPNAALNTVPVAL